VPSKLLCDLVDTYSFKATHVQPRNCGVMLTVPDLATFGAPPELIEVWRTHVHDLTDVQERAVRSGAIGGGGNLLVVAPTSSGKTFVGEMAASSSAFTQRQHAIFIVPYRALADEHYEVFRRRYDGILSVVASTSDWTEFDTDIRTGSFNLAVMTYEKLMNFMAQQPDLLGRCTTLVVDEVQSLSDGARGAKLEVLLTQVLLHENSPQILALSASLDNVNGLDKWLRATLVISTERPIPLTQSVCPPSGAAVLMEPGGALSTRQIVDPQPDRASLVAAVTRSFIASGQQVIIFCSTIRNVLETARRVRQSQPAAGVSAEIGARLNALDDSDAVNDLRLCLASGVGFHNADLTHPERTLVEDAFRAGDVRVLVATTTLAMGVNLPSDAVIVAASTRHVPAPSGWNVKNIPVSEYRNASGRAGRLGQRSAGFSLLVAENSIEQRQLVNSYLLGPVEPVRSQIPRSQLSDVVFDLICADVAETSEGLVDFITATYAYSSFYENFGGGPGSVRGAVATAVQLCSSSDLIVGDDGRLRPTQMARVFGQGGLTLDTSVRLARALEQFSSVSPCRQDLVFVVASCVEVGDRPWVRRRRGINLDPRPQHAPDGSGCAPQSLLAAILRKQVLSPDEAGGLVRAKCLLQWMSGESHRSISAYFQDMGAAAARIRGLGKNAAWLFDALAEAGQIHGVDPAFVSEVRTLALEARYGLPAPLAPLARLRVPGIYREHLLGLHKNSTTVKLYDPETILDDPDEIFTGLLSATQLDALRTAVLSDIEASMRRKRIGHVSRANQTGLPRRLVDDLYSATGAALEQAVADALILQPHLF
jgi:helicase